MSTKEKIIEIRRLKISFEDINILSNINMYLLRGENLAILGKSGQGKSVLLKCIIGLLKPDEGEIDVFGESVLDMNEDDLAKMRQRFGYLFQSGALYDSMSVYENLMFPMRRSNNSKSIKEMDYLIEESLESVGLLDALHKMPAELSGGMRKRAGLARTLVMKPEVILYDEPTTGLDPFTAEDISELIVKIQNKYKTSSIIVTHDMKCAKIASNRMHILNQGIFIAEGNYNELKNHTLVEVKSYFK
jgi:phospholipid/cholesterol/gamma-HCH transport system ATP-binding protein